ncbi:RNI-like protein [Rhizodiscina lignyota]|uniref:RNI-like protein n=1 Tax=Rhizodiscina lignyota TaxID=1504668 RepID=A0A9P4IRW3_9PEZI|nr:RNI-like protein [Rhizodiscina lignyota]
MPNMYTQTLDLSNIGSEIYYTAPPRGWLSTLMSRLPNLRSLIISNTDILNHEAVGHTVEEHESLRLLTIRGCSNLTSRALVKILGATTNLYYLDVSNTTGLGISGVFEAISELRKLGILRLSQLGLKDDDILNLTRFILDLRATSTAVSPQCLQCLDLRDNRITDRIVNNLIRLGEALPSVEEPPPYNADALGEVESGKYVQAPDGGWSAFFEPRIMSRSSNTELVDRQEDVVKHVRDPEFKSPVESGVLGQGLTHVYLSGNKFTASGISGLMKSLPLQVLDCGDVQVGNKTSTSLQQDADQAFAVREILDALPVCPSLRSLRIGHQIVTGFAGHVNKSINAVVNGADSKERPYPYSWLRNQGTQWDPTVLRSQPVKIFQFSPALLSISSLILTSVPNKTSNEDMTNCLLAFLEASADMRHVSTEYQRRRGQTNRDATETEKVPIVECYLQELRLEMQSQKSHKDQYDEDTQVYDDASRNDFSFFQDENDAYVSTHKHRGSVVKENGHLQNIDVIATLSGIRRKQREQLASPKAPSSDQNGFWYGKLVVIRNATT